VCFFLAQVSLSTYRELKKESYGVELLQAIGFVYASKAKHYLASEQTLFGVGGWLHNVQGKYHVFSETCEISPSLFCFCVLTIVIECQRSERR
jgi:hypothetical protein